MARVTEPMKMERIKNATMEIMAEAGYGGLSIAKISKKAGVSSGYLYLHYSGKEELVLDIIDANLHLVRDRILYANNAQVQTVYDFLYNIIDNFFELANSEPILARFITKLALELSVPTKAKEQQKQEMNKIAETILTLGRKTGEIDSQMTYREIELVFFTLPFRYIDLEFDENKNKKFTKKEIERLTEICMKATR